MAQVRGDGRLSRNKFWYTATEGISQIDNILYGTEPLEPKPFIGLKLQLFVAAVTTPIANGDINKWAVIYSLYIWDIKPTWRVGIF